MVSASKYDIIRTALQNLLGLSKDEYNASMIVVSQMNQNSNLIVHKMICEECGVEFGDDSKNLDEVFLVSLLSLVERYLDYRVKYLGGRSIGLRRLCFKCILKAVKSNTLAEELPDES